MKKKSNVKAILITILIVAIILSVFIYMVLSGQIVFETMGYDDTTVEVTTDQNELENGCFYVCSDGEYRLCTLGTRNWDVNKNASVYYKHTIWYLSDEDNIPVLKPGDKLVYISATTVPFEGIEWERFADYGYTIGVANMIGDESGHYHINRSDDYGYMGYIDPLSDANELEKQTSVSNLFLDKVGGTPVRDSLVSDGGTVLALDKDKSYVCEWYTGSYYQDYLMTANVHTFCTMESFTTYDYSFLHSNCIEIGIPSYLKSGVYDLNGIGLVRYVEPNDTALLDGNAYNSNIDWNDPIIVKAEDGTVIYDPVKGIYNQDYSDYDSKNIVEAPGKVYDGNSDHSLTDNNDYVYEDDMTGDSGESVDDDTEYSSDFGLFDYSNEGGY